MENIYDKGCELDNNDVIIDLEESFSSVFEQIVENAAVGENCNRNRSSSTSSDLAVKNDDSQSQPKRSQTNSTIVQKNLEIHLSADAQKRIQDILDEVRQLSEKEKLLLYLKLPTKAGSLADESEPIPLSNTRQEQTQAFQWIRSNLEECESTHTLPKHEVYDDYKAHCESLGPNRTLSAPDFGKIIKCVFPRVKARRLGTRGNSKYCYSGLRKKIIKESPSLPNLKGEGGEVNNNNSNNDSSSQCNEITEDQTLSAACTLVCEWANKLLGRVFSTLLDLARFLVGGSYVSTKSMAAFVVMSATESKVRKMSEKLQLWSSSHSSSDTKSHTESRSSPLRHSSSLDYNSHASKPKMTSSSQKSTQKGQQLTANNNVKLERPNSLPGLHVVTATSDSTVTPNQLMSPPPCPPPKTPHLTPKCSPSAASSPVFASHVPVQARGKTNGHSLLQTTDRIYSEPINPQPQHVMSPQNHVTKAMEAQKHRQTHIPRASTMLRRSDSCPYPSQSPRATRQLAMNQTSTLSPSDIARSQNWQRPLDGPCQTVMHDTSNTAIPPMRDMGKIVKDQMVSPMRNPTIQETMTTPSNRQPLLQRCHSVPVPFTTPTGEIYHPLTPQLGGLADSPISHRNPSYAQIKELRNKFLTNEVQSNARRNLTQYFTGNEQNTVGSERAGIETGNPVVTGNLENQKRVDINNIDIVRKPIDVANIITTTENIRNHSNAGVYNNGANRTIRSPCTTTIVSKAQETKQIIVNTMADEAPLVTVDNLIDPSFPIGDIPTSGGNGLGDFDGLDDATTMDLLRSLNSGNNIWANEWNNGGGIQLMESS